MTSNAKRSRVKYAPTDTAKERLFKFVADNPGVAAKDVPRQLRRYLRVLEKEDGKIAFRGGWFVKPYEGVECTCGVKTPFNSYVYAHWRSVVDFTCECGKRWRIVCGMVSPARGRKAKQ